MNYIKQLQAKVAELEKNQGKDPTEVNPKTILLIQDEDGNWRGKGQRFGKMVEVREASPEAALGRLLTHNGNVTTLA